MYLLLNLGLKWVGRLTPRPGCFTPGNDPIPLVEEFGWVPGLVWTVAEKLASPGFDPQTYEEYLINCFFY